MNFKHILTTIKYNKFFALIIVFQVALSMSVVSNSFFLSLNIFKEWSLPVGLATDDLITINAKTYQSGMNFQSLMNEDMRAFGEIDGVVGITPINLTPVAAGWPDTIFDGTGESKRSFQTHVFNVDANGLSVLGLQLQEGRNFEAVDVLYGDGSGNTNVVLVSEAMVKDLFADGSAIGKTIWLAPDSNPVEIVGIYDNFVGSQFLAAKNMPYRSILQPKVIWQTDNSQDYLLRVRSGAADAVKNAISDYYAQIPGRAGSRPMTLQDVKFRVFFERLGTLLMYLVISILLLIITFCGLIGLVNFIVSTRRAQIATRRALGAKRSRIVKEFITENMLITIVGVMLGLFFTTVISSAFIEFNGLVAEDLVYALFVGVAILLLNALAVTLSVRKTVYNRATELTL